MKIYNYSEITGEYLGAVEARIDPLESAKAGKNIYLIPAFSTTAIPPKAAKNQSSIYAGGQWSLADDYRGQTYYKKDTGKSTTITELGVVIPSDGILKAPPAGMFLPQWNGKKWIENALLYQEVVVQTKADVDKITARRIADLGEDKAKTEKLLAGIEDCPVWDEFIAARAAIIKEGKDFLVANKLN